MIEIKTETEKIIYSPTIKYPYVVRIMPDLNPTLPVDILVWCLGAHNLSSSKEAAEHALKINPISFENKNTQLVVITPALSRTSYNKKPLDTQILGRETMINPPIEKANGYFARPDLEILKMIDEVRESLISAGYKVEEKVLMGGVSAGAAFTNRFTILYPNKVKAAAILMSSLFLYPVDQINEYKLDYPFGINDIGLIPENRFNLELFKSIPHFIYVGKKDTLSLKDSLKYETAGNAKQEQKIKGLFGKNRVERTLNYVEYLQSTGLKVDFYTREELGHNTGGDVMAKTFRFLLSHTEVRSTQ